MLPQLPPLAAPRAARSESTEHVPDHLIRICAVFVVSRACSTALCRRARLRLGQRRLQSVESTYGPCAVAIAATSRRLTAIPQSLYNSICKVGSR